MSARESLVFLSSFCCSIALAKGTEGFLWPDWTIWSLLVLGLSLLIYLAYSWDMGAKEVVHDAILENELRMHNRGHQ